MENGGESDESTLAYEIMPRKQTAVEIYEEFLKLVEVTFGKDSKKYNCCIKLVEEFKAKGVSVEEFSSRMDGLLQDEPGLYVKFNDKLLPSLRPQIYKFEERHFLHSVQITFPHNTKLYDFVNRLVVLYREGKISLRKMTMEMRARLDDTTLQAYYDYVPEAEQLLDEVIPTRRTCVQLIAFVVVTAISLGLAGFLKK